MKNVEFVGKTLLVLFDTVFKMNVNTGQVIRMKDSMLQFDGEEVIDISDYVNRWVSSIDIYEDDIEKFEIFTDRDHLTKYARDVRHGRLFTFRKIENDELIWTQVLFANASEEDDSDKEILVFSRKLTSMEASVVETNTTMAKNCLKIIHHNFTRKTSIVITQPAYDRILSNKLNKETYEKVKRTVEEELIHPEDVHIFRKYMGDDFVKAYFTNNNKKLTFYYRRKVAGSYIWVQQEMIPSSQFKPDNIDMIIYISDAHYRFIDSHKNNLIQHGELNEVHYNDSVTTNMMIALNAFTSNMVEFYMIDLENDQFIRYKLDPKIPASEYVGSFANLLKKNIYKYLSGEKAEAAVRDFTVDKIREYLTKKVTIEFEFETKDGVLLHTKLLKVESVNGVPTKCLCGTTVVPRSTQLKATTFGSFEVYGKNQKPIHFSKSKSKEVLAYLIDKQGYAVSNQDIAMDVLERDEYDTNTQKYVSALIRYAIKDLERAGFENIILKERFSVKINTELLDCDYYHMLAGDAHYWDFYHNEYMRDYSWAEETNAELQQMFDK